MPVIEILDWREAQQLRQIADSVITVDDLRKVVVRLIEILNRDVTVPTEEKN